MKSYLASFILGLAAMAAFQSFHVKSEVASRETVIRCDDVAPLQDLDVADGYIVFELNQDASPLDGYAFIQATTLEAPVVTYSEGEDIHWPQPSFASSRPALHHQLAPPSELR
jgi:hypothetical protein